MYHYVARAIHGRLLYRTWREGLALWRFLARACPGPNGLVVMPNHVHLLHDEVLLERFRHALGSYTQWLNRARGTPGTRLWERPVPPPERIVGDVKRRRSERYLGLNPCRGAHRVVGDPLEFPLSSHRDATGLVLRPVRPPDIDPVSLHHYVSADPSVVLAGTGLPIRRWETPSADEVVAAASSAGRFTLAELTVPGTPRILAIRALRVLTSLPIPDIAEHLGVSARTVRRVEAIPGRDTELLRRLAGDPRFPALHDGDLLLEPGWAWYRRNGFR